MITLELGFLDDVEPPADHRIENAEHARANTSGAAANILCIHAIQSDREDESREGTDDRPRARVHEVIVVVLWRARQPSSRLRCQSPARKRAGMSVFKAFQSCPLRRRQAASVGSRTA